MSATLAKVEAALDDFARKKVTDEAVALLAELRESNAELKKTLANPASRSCRTTPPRRWRACARSSTTRICRRRSRTCRARSAGSTGSWAAAKRTSRVTIENLRQITDNLRDLTEDAKRYPANVIFGEPPKPPERAR